MQTFGAYLTAVGAGLLTYANRITPTATDRLTSDLASFVGGLGMGFLTFGVLGLILPWIKEVSATMKSDPTERSSRAFAVVLIWVCVAMILTFGVFGWTWNGTAALTIVLLIVTIVCISATVTSAMLCYCKFGKQIDHTSPASDCHVST